jgi:hypothetical protein
MAETVWVVTSDLDGVDWPVGVISTQAKAKAFVDAARPKERDMIPFEIDKIVGIDAQTPGEEKPEPPPPPKYDLDPYIQMLEERLGTRPKAFKSKLLRK